VLDVRPDTVLEDEASEPGLAKASSVPPMATMTLLLRRLSRTVELLGRAFQAPGDLT
jgi:hypothetical protein